MLVLPGLPDAPPLFATDLERWLLIVCGALLILAAILRAVRVSAGTIVTLVVAACIAAVGVGFSWEHHREAVTAQWHEQAAAQLEALTGTTPDEGLVNTLATCPSDEQYCGAAALDNTVVIDIAQRGDGVAVTVLGTGSVAGDTIMLHPVS